MKKGITIFIMALTILVLQACGGTPSNAYDFIIDDSFTEFITMGTSADFPPYEWLKEIDGKNQVVGIDIEIAKHIAKKEGKNLRVINKNFDYLIIDLANGKLDFVMAGLTINEDRAKQVSFSDFYYEAEDVLVIHKDDQDKYTSIEAIDLKNNKISTQSGTVQVETIDTLFTNVVKDYKPSMVQLVNELNDKRTSGIVMDKPVAEGYLKQFPNLVISSAEFPKGEDKFAVAVNKKSNDLLANINEVIKELKDSGKLVEIFNNMMDLV